MEFKGLKVKEGALQNVGYGSVVDTMDSFNGERGAFQRHEVFAKGQGVFHVITKAGGDKINPLAEVKIIAGELVADYYNGNSVAPAINIKAEKIVEIKGGK